MDSRKNRQSMNGWGPSNKRAALCITFDNFGEAFLINAGVWGDKPVGQHPMREFLPQIIEAVKGIGTTFFIEGWNAELYPESIRLWQDSGHEVALHGWEHEIWTTRDSEQRRDSLKRSMQAMKAIGVVPAGFRPPGGSAGTSRQIWKELNDVGLQYCSGLGEEGKLIRLENVQSLPFAWQAVDAFYLEEVTARLRVDHGFSEEKYSVDYWDGILDSLLNKIIAKGGQSTIIFHPHILAVDPAAFDTLKNFVDKVRDHPDIWVAKACDVALFDYSNGDSVLPH